MPGKKKHLVKFQSAPLTEARGDTLRRTKEAEYDKFQSAPLTEARGDPDPRLDQDQRGYGFNPLP